MAREIVQTDTAPQAIGPYSQGVRIAETLYVSGQIALDPQTMELIEGGIEAQARQVLENLRAVCRAGGAGLAGVAKLTVFLTEIRDFATVNAVLAEYFQAPYPARAAVGVAALPKGAVVEMEAIVSLTE